MARAGEGAGQAAFERLDGAQLCRQLAKPAGPPPRGRRHARRAAGRAGWLAASVAVLGASVAVAQQGDGEERGATSAGNSRGEAVEIEVRNRSRGETGLVTASDDYSLRLSNTRENGGGGAVYGCRAATAQPADERACLYADNLRAGEAFLFRSRQGTTVGHFDLGNPAGTPFTTNATGRVANLNADRLDDLHASEIVSQARAKAGLQAESADTATTADSADTATTADSATTADNASNLAGKGPASYMPLAGADSSDTNTLISAGSVNLLSVTLSPTVESRLLVSSNAEIDADGGGNDDAFCFLNRGASGNPSEDISERVTVDIPDTAGARGNIANHGSVVLAPGTHTIRLRCGVNVVGQNINFDSGDMHVLAVPTGG